MQIVIVLGLLAAAVALFAMEVFSVDIITLLLLLALVVTQVLSPAEAFAGFSNEIIIILAAIFVISGALQQTGAIDAAGARLHKVAGSNLSRLLVAVMATAGGLSAFMNNTTATAVLVSPVMGLARRAQVNASKLLMPLAFGSIMGGTCTLIGTSTNIAVSGYIAAAGMQPLALFEIAPAGLILVLVGILYMLVVGQRLLPAQKGESLTEDYAIREYLSEIAVMPGSHLVGQKIFESDLSRLGFRILAVLRGDRKILPESQTAVENGDVLLVEGKVQDLMQVKEIAGIEIKAELKLEDPELQSDDIRILEALIMPRSGLTGRTLKEINFRQRFGLVVLAIYRHGHSLRERIGHISLRVGDLLLIQGPAERLESLRRDADLWILDEVAAPLLRKKKAFYALGFFAASVVVGAMGWLPLSISFLAAAVLAILFRCITPEQAYGFIDWRLIILIGGMTAFGTAMEKSGAASFLAQWVVSILQPLGVTAVIAGFLLLTILLTQPMSNAAAALVVLPVALNTARQLDLNERTFAIAIMLGASISLIAPLEPACILVYGPGKYRFMDFVKTGLWLTLILAAILLFVVPWFWPL